MRQPAKQAKSRAVSLLRRAFPFRPAAPSTAVALALCLIALASMAAGYMMLAAGVGAVAAAWLIYVRVHPAPEALTQPLPRLPIAVAILAVLLTTIAMLPTNTKPGADQVGIHVLLLAGLLASAAALFSPLIDRFLRRRRIVLWLAIVAGSVAFTWAVYGSLIEARWFPIDDHEIMSFLGPKGKVSLSDIPAVLMTTEVGSVS